MAPPIAPTAIGACPAKADDLTPLINDEGNNFSTEADALVYFESNYSEFPPNALCKNTDGTYAINTSAIGDTIESALQKVDASVNHGSLLTAVVSLRASIQKLKETIGSAEQAIQELQAQLKTNSQQGLSADDAVATFLSVTAEFGVFTFLIGSSFYSADLFSSWFLGKMGPMAHLGMANRRAISSRINQFQDQHGLCGSLLSDKAITAMTHILGGCVAAYVGYQSMDVLFKYLNGKFYKKDGQAIDPALLKDPKQMGLVSNAEIAKAFAALNGKSDAELEAESDRLLKEFTGLELRHTALEINRAELTRVSRERLIARGILNEDGTTATPEGLMAKVWEKSKQAPSETIGMLVGFGLGVGAVAGMLHKFGHSKGMQALNQRALKNAVAAANTRIARLIESGKLTVCKGSHLTQDQLMALADKILRPQSEPQQLPLPGMGEADVPADGTRAELEITRIPTSARAGQTHWSAPTTNGSRSPVGANLGVRPTSIPDGVPSRPEFTSARPHVPTSAPHPFPVPIQGAMYTWFDDALPWLYDGEYIQLINTRLQATYAQWKIIFPAELANRYIAAAKNLVAPYARDHYRSVLEVSEAMKRFIFRITEKEITTEVLTVVVAGIRDTVSYPLQSEITGRINRVFAERERLRQYVFNRTMANPNLQAAMSLIDLEGYGTLQAGPSVIERVNQYLRVFEVETVAVKTGGSVVRLPISRATIVSERALATGTDGSRATGGRMGSAYSAYRGTATGTTGRMATVSRLPSATAPRAIPRTGGGNGAAFGGAVRSLPYIGWGLTILHMAMEGKASGQCGGFFDCINKGAEIMLTPPKYDPILNAPRS